MRVKILINDRSSHQLIKQKADVNDAFPVVSFDKMYFDPDGFLCSVWECEGYSDREEHKLEDLIKGLDERILDKSFLSVFMVKSNDVEACLDGVSTQLGDANENLQAVLDDEIDHIMKNEAKLNIPSNLRTVVTLKAPIKKFSHLGISERDIDAAETARKAVFEALTNADLKPTEMLQEDYVKMMRTLVCWARDKNQSAYDENLTICNQIAGESMIVNIEKDYLQVNDMLIKSFSARKLRSEKYLKDAFNFLERRQNPHESINGVFSVALNIFFSDRVKISLSEDEKKKANSPIGSMRLTSGQKKDAKYFRENGFSDDMKGQARPVKLSLSAFGMSDNEVGLAGVSNYIEQMFRECRINMQEEKFAALPTYTAHLPGGACADAMKSLHRYKSGTLFDGITCAPLFSGYKGNKNSGLLLSSRNGQIIRHDLGDHTDPHSVAIIGKKGSGKSAAAINISINKLKNSKQVRWLESTPNASILPELFSGSSRRSDKEILRVNPFSRIISLEGDEDTKSRMLTEKEQGRIDRTGVIRSDGALLLSLIESIISPAKQLPQDELDVVKNAVKRAWEKADRYASLHLVLELLEKESESLGAVSAARKLRESLKGKTAECFESEANIYSDQKISAVSLDKSMDESTAFAVTLATIFAFTLETSVAEPEQAGTVIVDAAERLMLPEESPANTFLSLAKGQIAENGSGFTVVAGDCLGSEASLMREMALDAKTKIILPHPEIEKTQILKDAQGAWPKSIAKLRNRVGVFSEMYVVEAQKRFIAQYKPSPTMKAIINSDSAYMAKFNQAIDSGMSPVEAITEAHR